MKVDNEVINYIREQIENISFGRVIIEIIDTSNKIDIITENKQRFYKNNKENEKKSLQS